ncbi:MAG: glycoside hydrolase family 27 protein [Bacteroidales bacterium]|nr:glycoside hydrolase family 27 protein [Bacteroidales bacterium]
MNNIINKKYSRFSVLIYLILILLISTGKSGAQSSSQTSAPFLGWNSYDCYGTHINEKLTLENLDAFIQKLKPYGYEYFVIDAGWYRYYDLKPGEIWPTDGDKMHLTMDEFGRFTPAPVYFPDGIKAIVDYAHKHGVKFGLHLMRGISREAVEKNLPIRGTKYFARDIANVNDTCNWSNLNYGINMDKPGAQEYYNSVVELLADWGVDFIKYDDIVHKPREINAVADAIEKTGKKIVLSISPGDDINPEFYKTYQRADMIRISRDVWDLQEDIDISFERWEHIKPYADKGFWLDMDMIPFGHIRINYPVTINKLKSTRGYARMDYFSYSQKKTFITQRAMAASPLFMGGALISSPKIVFELITNEDMLACNQNGVTGELVTRVETYAEKVDVWKTPHKTNENEGWIGIFNRNAYMELIKLDKQELGLSNSVYYNLYDIWGKRILTDSETFILEIPGNDVIFIHYKIKNL